MLNEMKKLWSVTRQVTPHPYQIKAHADLFKAWEVYRRLLCCLPTGGGKTITAGEPIAQVVESRNRSLVLAHSRKLVRQFKASLEDNYGLQVGIEMGPERSHGEPVVCATFQSMINRIQKGKFHADDFELIVPDEAHRVLAEGYLSVLQRFHGTRVLGLTASPRRSDQRDLMSYFEHKAVDVPLFDLIRDGYLCDIIWHNIPINIRLEAKGQEFTDEECDHAIEPFLPSVLEEFWSHSRGQCSLIFLPLIPTSKKCVEILRELGCNALHIDGTMKDRDQDRIIRQLQLGEVDVLCNAQLLSEGVDIRCVNNIMPLRVYRAWTPFVQCVGRGTRTFDPLNPRHGPLGSRWPLKTVLTIRDPLWLCSKHSLIRRPACLLATSEKDEEEIEKKMKGGMTLYEAQQNITQDREESLRKEIERLAKRKARLASAFEVFAGTGDVDGAEYEPMSRWQRDKITPGQEAILRSEGIDLESVKDKGHGFLIIEAIKQRRTLGLANTRMAHEALQSGMSDALQRSREDVVEYLSAIKRGENPYADIPPI